jgi:imidazolonepropionase-like amidohydrolase
MQRKLNKLMVMFMAIAALSGPTGSLAARGDTAAVMPENALVIINGTVIDGTGAAPILNGAVVIQDNRILAVGQAIDFVIPDTATVIDAQGGTIMPGFINAHVHYVYTTGLRRLFLAEGVTTVCDLASSLGALSNMEQANSSANPTVRVFASGPFITSPGGYPGPVHGQELNYEVTTPEEGRAAVIDLVGRGADYIKISLDHAIGQLTILEPETVQAIVEEAHAQGVQVRAHMTHITRLDVALAAGVDVIEHVPSPRRLPPEEFERLLASTDPFAVFFDELHPEYPAQLAQIAEHGIVMVPTLDALVGSIYEKANPSPEEQLELAAMLEFVRRFHAAGGIIALGNDYNVHVITQRLPLREMNLLLAAGLTPMEVIEAGTRHAAAVCGQGDELGTLEAGKLADIIIVNGDPLTDMAALTELAWVIFDGEVVITPG